MEILNKLLLSQNNLEDALKLEIEPEDIKLTDDGKKLFRWLKQRRRKINYVVKYLYRFFV